MKMSFDLDSETLLTVIRAGLPHAEIGTNISKKAAGSATIVLGDDGGATITIDSAGLSIGAKGGGGRKKKAASTETTAATDEASED